MPVALAPIAAPTVKRVHLKQQVRPIVHVLVFHKELEIEREAEVADILCAFDLILVFYQINSCLANLCAT